MSRFGLPWVVGLPILMGSVLPVASLEGQASIEIEARTITDHWASGNADGIGRLLHEDGVQLTLLGREYGKLGRRQAVSALAEFLEQHRPTGAELTRAIQVRSDPLRGFAETRLGTVVPGTREVLDYTIFTEFARVGDSWWISEVRVLQ